MTGRPAVDTIFDALVASKFGIAPQQSADVSSTLAGEVDRLTQALGVPRTALAGSATTTGGDHVDRDVVLGGFDLRTTIAKRTHGDLSVFLISARHLRGTDAIGRHERLLVQRGGLSVCEVLVSTTPRRQLAGAHPVELDQVQVRITSGMDTVLGRPLTKIVEVLRQPPVVDHMADADLAGVDLGGGRVIAPAGRTSTIEWPLQPSAADDIVERLRKYAERCFAEFQFGTVPQLETTTTRSWNSPNGPNDQTGPFTDLVRRSGRSDDGRVRITLSTVAANWKVGEVDHVSVTLDMRTTTDRLHVVASGRSGRAECTNLTIRRPTSGAAIQALWQVFADLLSPG